MSIKSSTGSEPAVYAPTRSIEIDDVDVDKHGLNVESLMVDLSLDSFGYFSIIFAGVGNSADGMDWIDNELFRTGRKVAVKIGQTNLIVGEISMVRTNFPSSGSPSIEIIGDDSASFKATKKRRRAAIAMRYGNELISFNSEIDNDSQSFKEIIDDLANGRMGSLSATKGERRIRSRFVLDCVENEVTIGFGECIGSPNVVPGRTLALEGLGVRLSRRYRLIGSIHTMDQRLGYRTTFMAIAK